MKKSTQALDYLTSDSHLHGKTYGQWTVEWWRWFLSTPKSNNPVLDSTGEYANVNQPPCCVWFLAGKLADEDSTVPSRICAIPSGRSILFPVINCEANPLEYPELKSRQDLIDHVVADENTIRHKICVLDGRKIPALRVTSDPPIFDVKINEDNIYDIKGKTTIAYGDGYWVFLKPLHPGEHMLSFQGSCENGRLRSGAKYILRIGE